MENGWSTIQLVKLPVDHSTKPVTLLKSRSGDLTVLFALIQEWSMGMAPFFVILKMEKSSISEFSRMG